MSSTLLRISYRGIGYANSPDQQDSTRIRINGTMYDYVTYQIVPGSSDGSRDIIFRFTATIVYDLDENDRYLLPIELIKQDVWGEDICVFSHTYQLNGEESKMIDLNEEEFIAGDDRRRAYMVLSSKGSQVPIRGSNYPIVGFETGNSNGNVRLNSYGGDTSLFMDDKFVPPRGSTGYLRVTCPINVIIGPKFCFMHYDLFWKQSSNSMRLKMKINGNDVPLPKIPVKEFRDRLIGVDFRFFYSAYVEGKETKSLFGRKKKFGLDLKLQLLDENTLLLEKTTHIEKEDYNTVKVELEES